MAELMPPGLKPLMPRPKPILMAPVVLSYDLNDVAFDSRALTIRVKDRLDTFSDATYYRLQSLALLATADDQLLIATNGISLCTGREPDPWT
jgi:hypothetical protein